MANKDDDMYYYDIIRANIKKYRKEKNLTQQKLAEMADISHDYLAEIESTKRRKTFSIAVLGRISNALNVSIKNFFEQ